MKYPDHLTLREARREFFEKAGFDESGYLDPWVKVRLGPLPIFFPNTLSRARAVRWHDLHHVLTEYDTSLIGEADVSQCFEWNVVRSALHEFDG